MNKILIKHFESLPEFRDVCGKLRVFLGADESEHTGFALATMEGPSEPHYHKILTEYYYVLEGIGTLIVSDQRISYKPDILVTIPPNNPHFTIPRIVTRVLAVTSPTWVIWDQFLLNDKHQIEGYTPEMERAELARAAFFRSRTMQIEELKNLNISELREMLKLVKDSK